MDRSTVRLDDSVCKIVDKKSLKRLLDCSEEAVNRFIGLNRSAFIDLNPDGQRRNYVIPRARLDRILLGDTDPLEAALANPKPQPRRVRKPLKQHV